LERQKMDGYVQVFDSSKHGRTFVARLGMKILAVGLLVAFIFLTFGDGVGTGSRIAGGAACIVGLAIAYFAFFRSYLCPRCRRGMRIQRKARVGAGGAPLLLVCDRCRCFIDLKAEEE